MSGLRVSDIIPPDRLDANARYAWAAVVRSIEPGRVLTEADLMRLEAGCRAWSRWRALDGKITDMSRDNSLAGEMAKSAAGGLQVSPLRHAADAALREYTAFTREFGVALPADQTDVPSTDLFGYPDRAGRGQRGRPRFQPTARDHNRVRLLLAMGWSNPRIAAALEISLPTLHRYFGPVLGDRAVMRDRLDARRLEVTADLAFAGNAAALKELDRLIERNDLMEAKRRSEGPPPDEPEAVPEPVPRGKKEIAQAMAETAGANSDYWGDLLKPPGRAN